ncbi:superoxide dismutase family protein [Paracoccus sulfuroxidans]|uniref:Cu-Zn family superoxide dismutase n=1 Tax=Paracoccus sulfuroxidans TaxID=384678 RepID=A0A562NG70_9RHOB|nr:superoxide dismutase family protein [Paracoccus sulfuroxidans]TWI31192.1 Cu-Zn family superoxide dismutase [Paracoccus sulfuroxidans]
MKQFSMIFTAALFPIAALAQDATAKFVNTDGAEIGSASLTQTAAGVLIKAEIGELPPDSWVAFHIHETGSCDPATKHDSAGGHFNPTGVEHGYLSETGPHAGDMPNQRVDATGMARFEVFNPSVTLTEGDKSITSRALMIHAKADDYSSQPSGAAGDRLACAVIE